MIRAIVVLLLIALAVGGLSAVYHRAPNAGLPVVQTAVPKHGFVCVPSITPKVGPSRQRTWT